METDSALGAPTVPSCAHGCGRRRRRSLRHRHSRGVSLGTVLALGRCGGPVARARLLLLACVGCTGARAATPWAGGTRGPDQSSQAGLAFSIDIQPCLTCGPSTAVAAHTTQQKVKIHVRGERRRRQLRELARRMAVAGAGSCSGAETDQECQAGVAERGRCRVRARLGNLGWAEPTLRALKGCRSAYNSLKPDVERVNRPQLPAR